MEKVKRSIFFWTLAALFLVIAPAIIMRATGLNFDLNRGVFVHSGTLSLKVNPKNPTVYLDGELVKSGKINRINNSFNISGLIPRDYEIKITNEGFQSWSKKIDIHSGLSSEFWNIVLARNSYERTPYNLSDVNKFFISPKNRRLAYVKEAGSNLEVGILETRSNLVEKNFFLNGWKFIETEAEENIEWSPEEDYLSIPVKKVSAEDNEIYYFIINLKTEETSILNQLTGKNNLSKARWDPKDKDYLFFISEKTLYRANVKKASEIIAISEDVSAYELSYNAVYFSEQPNELIYKSELDGSGEKIQITNQFPLSPVLPIKKLIVYDETRIAFINQANELFIFNQGEHENYFKKIGDEIMSLQFSNDGKKLLFWTDYEASVYFLRDWMVQPNRSEDEIQNIIRYSEPIKNIQWFKDYEHIIFSDNKQLRMVEIDTRDRSNYVDITETQTPSFLIYNNAEEKLFFTDNIPNEKTNGIFSIIFLEPSNILGL